MSDVYDLWSKVICSIRSIYRFSNVVPATDDALLCKKREFEENKAVENAQDDTGLDYKQVKTWVEFLSQFGLATRGIVYGVIGFLAALAAVGAGGKTTDPSGALQEIAVQPFGKPLLIVIVVGLIGYALWRFVQAVADPENKGKSIKGIILRISDFVAGVGYLFLVFAAWQIIRGLRADNGNMPEDWTARVLAMHPYGKWLVIIVGMIIIGVGIYQLYKVCTAKFRKDFDFSKMSGTMQWWMTHIGRVGFASLGIVFNIIGIFLIQAALHHNPEEAGGLGQALLTLLYAPYGRWVLGIVSTGFLVFGIYSILMARYRRIFI